jgi:hypothetical protein
MTVGDRTAWSACVILERTCDFHRKTYIRASSLHLLSSRPYSRPERALLQNLKQSHLQERRLVEMTVQVRGFGVDPRWQTW